VFEDRRLQNSLGVLASLMSGTDHRKGQLVPSAGSGAVLDRRGRALTHANEVRGRRRAVSSPVSHVHGVGRNAMEPEETGIELLLSEPEIVAWLELTGSENDEDEPERASNP
jgi:hypothetical protein